MSTNKPSTLFPISIITGAIIIAIAVYTGLSNQQTGTAKENPQPTTEQPITAEKETPNPLLALTQKDHIYGNPDAEISLIEYSDFECPFCQRFHPTPKQVVDQSDGKVNWVYRHYPLAFHDPAATLEAEASECANEQGGNEAFWNYADLIYENTTGNGRGIDKSRLITMAESLNLDKNTFEECLESGKYKDRVKQDFNNGTTLGVSGTPATFVVNHQTGKQTLIKGAQSPENIKAIVESLK